MSTFAFTKIVTRFAVLIIKGFKDSRIQGVKDYLIKLIPSLEPLDP